MSESSEPPHPPPTTSSTSTATAPDDGPRVTGEQVRDVSLLQRSASDRKVAGVAGGIARHLDIDPTVVRVLLVVLCFFGGAGLLLYAAGWLLIPDERTGRAVVPSGDDTRRWLLYGVLALVAIVALGGGWGGWGWGWGPTVPLVVLAILAAAVLAGRDARRGASSSPTSVEDAAHPRAAWAPPPYTPPRRPRRTGTLLFWPTLALIAVASGVLGVYDAAHRVDPAAYPALALAVTGLMLVVGAFRGRPGGLALLGVLAALAMAVGSLAGGFSRASSQTFDPRTAAQLRAAYTMQTGQLTLDLTQLGRRQLAALDGREIDVTGDTGELLVIVPRDLRTDVDAEIGTVGGIDIGDQSTGGVDADSSRSFSGSAGSPTIALDLHLQVGHIEVRNDDE